MMKEVNSFAELPRADDPELELGDVYRVRGEIFGVGLISSGAVLKWDGRAWVPLNGFKTAQNETDGKKNDVNTVGGAANRVNGHLIVYPYDAHPGAGECYDCGAHDFDEPCEGPFGSGDAESDAQGADITEISAGWPPSVIRTDIREQEQGADEQGADELWNRVGDRLVPVGVPAVMKRHSIQAVDADADVIARWMPRDFVQWYVALVSLITGPSGYGGVDENVVPGTGKAYGGMGAVKSASSESLKLTGGQFRPGSAVLMRSEWASDMRVKVDRKLRKIARDLKNMLDDDSKRRSYVRRRCAGQCKKFGEADWLYCAKCGGRMEQVD
jgi:hypothetical protein